MTERSAPGANPLPFLIGDAVLVAFAAYLAFYARPFGTAQMLACLAALAAAALLGCWPFVLKHQAALRLTENDQLTDAVAKIQQLEQVARQISSCTNAWDAAQTAADKTVALAKGIAAGMTDEAARFRDFMGKAADSEKRTLTFETEKLRRAQGDWLSTVVALLDHVNALHAAAVRSGQENVIAQLTRFRAVCHDLVRRQGLVPFVPEPGAPFDDAAHALADENAQAEKGATIGEVLATGINFQGQLLRKSVVSLAGKEAAAVPAEEKPETQQALL
ncbi:MAG: nucleotide exchange factor GrpE [Verrucomicrobia bacterium]|nr:nucleotide exchange factor GrpE [Verrucomicrobiota bacterium]